MKIQKYSIYNLDFSYTRIETNQTEIDFRGILSYHTKDLDLLKETTKGELELDSVNVFLSFQIQRHIDVILQNIEENDVVTQRPIITNRLKMVLRRELEEIGLEFVDFKRISLWSHGAADRGVNL
ncbi:MAG: hypothetical protein ACW97X_14235 [Candidatus Hodarchaeales archaeon]|jgi:hypothetical protein